MAILQSEPDSTIAIISDTSYEQKVITNENEIVDNRNGFYWNGKLFDGTLPEDSIPVEIIEKYNNQIAETIDKKVIPIAIGAKFIKKKDATEVKQKESRKKSKQNKIDSRVNDVQKKEKLIDESKINENLISEVTQNTNEKISYHREYCYQNNFYI